MGVEHFKLNKNKTKRFKTCRAYSEAHKIHNSRNNPIYNPIYNPINNPINNPTNNPINHPIYNPIHNAKNNAKNNAKTQELARVENEERIRKMPKREESMLSWEEATRHARQIMAVVVHGLDELCLEELLGIFPQEFCDPRTGLPRPEISSFTSSFYIGYTGRQIEDEWLRWLTTRGVWKEDGDGNRTYSSTNRPVLLWADDGTITMKSAEKEMGFGVIEVYSSTLMVNARYIEKALQVRYKHLPLGHRLVRAPDKGKKYDLSVDGKVHKVFITFSFDVAKLIANGTIKINY